VNFGGIRVFLNELSNVQLLEEDNRVIIRKISILNLNDWVFIDDSD
jgi:hypothetical protein